MSFRKALGDDNIRRRIERHPDVRARDFKIGPRIHSHAMLPIHDAILARVNRGLKHGVWNIALQRINKITGAAPGVALRQHSAAMLLQDTQADGFGGIENRPTGHGASNRGGQGNDRGNISGRRTKTRGIRLSYLPAATVTK
jgi:hypothetical protein